MSLLLAEETQRIDFDVRVFTVRSYPARFLGNEHFRNLFLRDRENIVAVIYALRNWRGCFQPMIDVNDNLKDSVMLSGFVQPSNSTFSSERIIHTSKALLIFLVVHSLVGR